jgi:signal transduction histidine kinase
MPTIDDEALRSMLRFGLARAIQLHSEDVRARFPALALELDLVDDENLLSETASQALLRVYLEAMHNVEQHSQAGAPEGSRSVLVRVYLSGGMVRLEIRDDGQSFSIPADWARFARGQGVMGMKTRLEALGGTLQVSGEPGPGVTIQAGAPIQQ